MDAVQQRHGPVVGGKSCGIKSCMPELSCGSCALNQYTVDMSVVVHNHNTCAPHMCIAC